MFIVRLVNYIVIQVNQIAYPNNLICAGASIVFVEEVRGRVLACSPAELLGLLLLPRLEQGLETVARLLPLTISHCPGKQVC